MKIAIGNDHAGVDYKFAIINHLKAKGYHIINYGTDSKQSVDYPDFVHPVAKDIENDLANFGIVICGSGNGVNMTVNKYHKVRAALCWNNEIVKLSRQHNDANILSIPALFTSEKQVITMVDTFINTSFDGDRHIARIKKIPLTI